VGRFLAGLGSDWIFVIGVVYIVWLVLSKGAQTVTAISDALGPAGRVMVGIRDRRRKKRVDDANREAEYLALAISTRSPEYLDLKERFDEVGRALRIMRAFIVYDEDWHFRDQRDDAAAGRTVGPRLCFDDFAEKFAAGWRPGSEDKPSTHA
jgi:hypothetical protein